METIPFESLIFVCSVAVQILLGLALADFISGALHWLEDSYGKEEWPIIGYYVIEPNNRAALPADYHEILEIGSRSAFIGEPDQQVPVARLDTAGRQVDALAVDDRRDVRNAETILP